jgi:hypothetical protein
MCLKHNIHPNDGVLYHTNGTGSCSVVTNMHQFLVSCRIAKYLNIVSHRTLHIESVILTTSFQYL